MKISKENKENWKKKLMILGILIGIIMITAELDWAAEHSSVGWTLRSFWIALLIQIGIFLPMGFIYLAGNNIIPRKKNDSKLFLISLILFGLANGIPIYFYVGVGISPGFLLYLQLILMGLIPAYILQPKNVGLRHFILVMLSLTILIPIGYFINDAIDDLWAGTPTMDTLYYMFFWGLFMPFLYLILAIGWKFGGGSKRQSWNIFVSAMLLQTSTLEDFFYFLLNGQPLPGVWPWMKNFVINLEVLFGHVPTDLDLLIFCSIITSIAILILFDVHGYIWNKYISKTK